MTDFDTDHHRFDMQGEIEKLPAMLLYAFSEWPHSAAIARSYIVQKLEHKSRLILYWSKVPNTIPIFNMGSEAAAQYSTIWFNQEAEVFRSTNKEPRTDGSTEVGVRVYNEKWGYVDGSSYAICAIEPVWLVFGK